MSKLVNFYKPAPTTKPLSEWLYACRAEKPDEWKMDEYIRGALYLEQRIAELEKLIVDSFETEEGEYHLSREWLKLTESKQKLKWEDL